MHAPSDSRCLRKIFVVLVYFRYLAMNECICNKKILGVVASATSMSTVQSIIAHMYVRYEYEFEYISRMYDGSAVHTNGRVVIIRIYSTEHERG